MEAQEEVMAAGSASSLSWDGERLVQPAVAKGKRTKRPRTSLQHQQRSSAVMCSSALDSPSASSTEASESFTEEDEDLAVCLILLARGRASDTPQPSPEEAAAAVDGDFVGGSSADKPVNIGASEAAAGTTTAGGKLCVYECRTCNKSFPSFQALGGHRASHKKPKLTAAMAETTTAATAAAAAAAVDDKKLLIEEDTLGISASSFPKSNLVNENGNYGKVKIHECSICGSEFSSGQALGGHMRRHRPPATAAATVIQESKKQDHHHHHHRQRSQLLSLDLNLPAPADDHAAISQPPSPAPFPFAAGERPLLFAASASALVDCHY